MADRPVSAPTVRLKCPECHQTCFWCSWYVKHAREVGCGTHSGKKCEKAEAIKGTKCGTCDGSGIVTATIHPAHAATHKDAAHG